MRYLENINKGWSFEKQGKVETVDLPHTWNGVDGQDGGNDYYRGECVYKRHIEAQGEVNFVKLYGVNSSCRLTFNGKEIGSHYGGYSAFVVELPEKVGELCVYVDNYPNDFVYPQQADFTFYGGIYRDVELICVDKAHFVDEFHITPILRDSYAEVKLEAKASVENSRIEYEIVNDGKAIYRGEACEAIIEKENLRLWNGTIDPHLYVANAYLLVDGKVVDKVSTRFGVRSFEITADRGFLLNGQEYPLRGVSRHQDRPNIGNALSYEHHKEDIDLICEMGANTVRLAHYQHSQDFYDLCDEKGLVVWAEIPFISKFMPKGEQNTYSQMRELINQCYNHPSIVVWGLSNEITMGGKASNELVENHKKLNDLCHKLDSTRKTTIAALTMCDIDNPYIHISDVVSYNHYFGWYGGNVSQNGPWFDKFHAKYPSLPIGISEYGCEALDWHTSTPQQGDYTEEYQAYYHEELIKQIMERPYLWATHVWNMFDFAADARAEGGENGMNHKGLVTFDRKYKKDSFYAYKAWLSNESVLHICSKRYVDRVEDITRVTVYSNCDEVSLYANDTLVETQKKGKYPFFYFDVKNEGETHITARAGELSDEAFIRKVSEPNMSYVMKEQGAVINWFEIETPNGYFSVNDTIGDILSTAGGKLFCVKMLLNAKKLFASNDGKKKNDVMGFSFDLSMLKSVKGYYNMLKSFTVKRGISMLGGKFTKEQILYINSQLNKIKKPRK